MLIPAYLLNVIFSSEKHSKFDFQEKLQMSLHLWKSHRIVANCPYNSLLVRNGRFFILKYDS